MRPLYQITGRLGNQMFQFAFIYAWAKDHGTDVFLQDPKYFEKYANEIKSLYGDLTWTGENFYEMLDDNSIPFQPVSLHVRRGDYVGNSFYVDLTATDYYQRAMREFPDRKFLIFSDDINWCRQQKLFEDCYFNHGTELEDLNLMMRCNGHIIANSTFSWWGGYLGKGKIVAPRQWYTDGVERTVCPTTWIKV